LSEQTTPCFGAGWFFLYALKLDGFYLRRPNFSRLKHPPQTSLDDPIRNSGQLCARIELKGKVDAQNNPASLAATAHAFR